MNVILLMWLSMKILLFIILPVVSSLSTSNAKPECVNSADFYYEIVLALSSYPPADCSKKENMEISKFLQHEINRSLKSTPGTINTKNKICKHVINNRRLLQQEQQEQQQEPQWPSPMTELWNSSFDFFGLNQDHRALTHSFFYIGGGRCRFCFLDDNDKRRQLLRGIRVEMLGQANQLQATDRIDDDDNNLFGPKVSDISLCPSTMTEDVINTQHAPVPSYDGWTNKRVNTIKGIDRPILGPYKAGESFGHVFSLQTKRQFFADKKKEAKKPAPVEKAHLHFTLWAFDVPNQYTHKIFGDEPFYLFVNGIKLDFNLLLKAPGVDIEVSDGERNVMAKTFAGIIWFVDEDVHIRNRVLGPQVDRKYIFQLSLPPILFEHGGNKLHVEFFIKPEAKAKSYGLAEVRTTVSFSGCEITGLEKSPFDDFKVVMENRLENKLGLDMSQRFQNKQGHCLKDKVPMVGVHLVQKDKWANANPRC